MDIDQELAKEQLLFEDLIQGLINNGFGYCDDFLAPNVILGLRNNIKNLLASGKMRPAGVGNKQNLQQDQEVRGDRIKWLEQNDEDRFEKIFVAKIDKFIKYLNKTCFTSIIEFESHYASYERNSFYKRHLDQFKNDKGRKFSLVLYLNEDWKKEDGGILSLYPENREQKDFSPFGGRLMFFRSDEMEHEVHPSFTRDRISIAGWLKN